MNKKIGNDFERELGCILAVRGYWVHNFAQNKSGQPADLIAVKNRASWLIDCKVCSNGVFRFDRMEENQRHAMKLWEDCGNSRGWFALQLPDGSIYMFMLHSLVDLEKRGKTELKEAEIRYMGIELEKWLCWSV